MLNNQLALYHQQPDVAHDQIVDERNHLAVYALSWLMRVLLLCTLKVKTKPQKNLILYSVAIIYLTILMSLFSLAFVLFAAKFSYKLRVIPCLYLTDIKQTQELHFYKNKMALLSRFVFISLSSTITKLARNVCRFVDY